MMKITRGFLWMQEALGLGHAPDDVHESVQPVVDADQRGWGHADTEIVPFSYTLTTTTPPQTYDLLTGTEDTTPVAPDLTRQIVVMGLSVAGAAASLPGDVWLTFRSGPNGAIIIHKVVTIGTDLAFISGAAVFPSPLADSSLFLPAGHLWVPRGYRPQLRVYAYDTVVVVGVAAIMRAGFSGGAP